MFSSTTGDTSALICWKIGRSESSGASFPCAERPATPVVSGRKIPRDGGIILAVGANRRTIEAIVAEDPFVTHGLADVRILEFRASQRAANIQERIAKG